MAKKSAQVQSVRDAFRVLPESFDLAGLDPAAAPVGPKSKAEAAADMVEVGAQLDDLQEALYAEGTGGGRRSVLLVLQGMDTSGKGGTIRHVAGLVNPQGLHIASFKKPTAAERRHDFLWRIRRQVPAPGMIGVFDRSHYEEVLIARVDGLVPAAEWRRRYELINEFESELVGSGVTVVKCFLHISPERQKERLVARLEDPAKRWKYNPHDIEVRAKFSQYRSAYQDALVKCATPVAPWFAIPSDRKWYRNWAVARVLLETLQEVAPVYPEPSYDPLVELARLREADPLR
ncbi:PPK2 family polyphosphate:nucleotide phosphotransferase [Saccharothrix tamanrassetensis]|uniref:PPK2 family polyphosphate:nucleotide phosphotransferase n=1 Tax=Saccharothrix tamanrassetensis TaxID=1051531 RepID=A0A841CQF9_9PSEU|nr:PPK2 family polyphosphate kinase [Saccharothrix tamanrassetensis]MBB5958368.1 PPK2 family polyphosphate:nucleotide phosphotransferase [Saccharothrix tamanrassetensis]